MLYQEHGIADIKNSILYIFNRVCKSRKAEIKTLLEIENCNFSFESDTYKLFNIVGGGIAPVFPDVWFIPYRQYDKIHLWFNEEEVNKITDPIIIEMWNKYKQLTAKGE